MEAKLNKIFMAITGKMGEWHRQSSGNEKWDVNSER